MRQKLPTPPGSPVRHAPVSPWWKGACGLVALALLAGIALLISTGKRSPRHVTEKSSHASAEQIAQPHTDATTDFNARAELDEIIARFFDERLSLEERIALAKRLARDGSPAALAELHRAIQAAPPERQALLVQLIGQSGHPAAQAWLLSLLEDKNERLVIAAMRGLSAMGGEEVTARFAKILADNTRAESVRVEAALGLGSIGTAEGRAALTKVFQQTAPGELAAQILNSLGRFEFPTVAETFTHYLAAPETSGAMRVTAVEALAHSSEEAVAFLLEFAKSDADAEVRASAAWAISNHGAVEDAAPVLTALAERERAVDVRRRLYEALLPQEEIPAQRLLPLVLAEQDIAARVAGFNVLGSATHQEPASEIAATFDREIVPELQRIATAPNSLNIQMRAVFALRHAQTDAAQAALAIIAGSPRPPVATAARNGIFTTQTTVSRK